MPPPLPFPAARAARSNDDDDDALEAASEPESLAMPPPPSSNSSRMASTSSRLSRSDAGDVRVAATSATNDGPEVPKGAPPRGAAEPSPSPLRYRALLLDGKLVLTSAAASG